LLRAVADGEGEQARTLAEGRVQDAMGRLIELRLSDSG
jgi:hypothetical protein